MRRRRDEGATATLELVILAPVVFMVLSLMFAFGRISQAESLVDQASRDGARAATAQNSRGAAPTVAAGVVESTMRTAPTSCQQSTRARTTLTDGAFELPDLSDPTAVEQVQVSVSCSIDLSDLAFLPLDDFQVPIRRDFVSPLDRYRGYTR